MDIHCKMKPVRKGGDPMRKRLRALRKRFRRAKTLFAIESRRPGQALCA